MAKVLAVLWLLGVPLGVFSASPALRAVRVEHAPVIDGLLDDSIWRQIPPEEGLRQVFPFLGDPTEKTEVRVAFDGTHLYFAIYCFDSEPAKIAAHSMAHDGYEDEGGDDIIKILLDPLLDEHNAYLFVINARGARSEGLAFGDGASFNWDGLWDARSRIQADGWSCEITIPFRTLSFKPGAPYWGLNIERYISRKQETVRLSGVRQDYLFNNAVEAAHLHGLENLETGIGLTIKPYGIIMSYKNHLAPSANETRPDGGCDIYQNFAPNLIGAFSYRTDFAETEVDERQINLTRFPLFFPEKRMFFLEGSEIFNFGPNAAGQDEDPEFIPFFSRRIGLFKGKTVPIVFGAKIYGKLGRTSLAFLDVLTDEVKTSGLQRQNYFVARVTQDVLAESKVGFLVTDGSPSGKKNALAGIDFNYQTSRFLGRQNLIVSGWYVHNWNVLKTGKHQGYGVVLDYPNDLWNIYSSYAYYGDSLNPALGYVRRNGVRNTFFGIGYQPRPDRGLIGRAVRQFFFQWGFDAFWDLSGRPESRSLFVSPLSFVTESGESVEVSLTHDYDVLSNDFGVSDLVVIPSGAYDFTACNLYFQSAPHRPFVFELAQRFGGYYSGRLEETDVGVLLKGKGYLTFGCRICLVNGRLPQGNFRKNLYEAHGDVFLSPRLGVMSYLQYDDVSRALGINIRFRWEIPLGYVIHFVYTKSWDRVRDPRSRFAPREEDGVFKILVCIGL